jgi:hypothetical protein
MDIALGRAALPSWRRTTALYCRSMEKNSHRLKFWMNAVFSPTAHEWRLVELPPMLFRAYWLVRPLRLTAKYATALFRKG